MSEIRSTPDATPPPARATGSSLLRGPLTPPMGVGGDSSTQLAVPIPGEIAQATIGRPDSSLDDQVTIISSRGPIAELGEGRMLAPLEVGKMLEGERLGQFVLQKYVGGGGMGAIFRSLDTTLNREVAVKVLSRISIG